MSEMTFTVAIDWAVETAMSLDERVVVLGEDVHMLRSALYTRYGKKRVMATPISESAFLGAAVGAAMGGLRPIAELLMVDFVAVALDPLLNHAAKLEVFSGGRWRCPVVFRIPVGAGYGDGGQHGQALWGMLAAIPGLTVVVPSTPADAAGLMAAAIKSDDPVVFMEHKLLSEIWLESLGRAGRETVSFDVPAEGAAGDVPERLEPLPFGQAVVRRQGDDVTVASVAVGVHRALAAAEQLAEAGGPSCEVIDLRCLRPLDVKTVVESVERTGRLLVVDEDYREYGLSGELAAIALEAGLTPRFGRVCVENTLPYARHLEDAALPNPDRIAAAVQQLVKA